MRDETLKALLDQELSLLLKSQKLLEYSLNKCEEIGIKKEYSMADLTEYESLSSRYSRTSDILTQKVLKTLFIYLQEDARFFIDRCNLSEKLGLVESSDDLYNIRKLRNEISHEYAKEEISEIYMPLLGYSKTLSKVIDQAEKYIQKLE